MPEKKGIVYRMNRIGDLMEKFLNLCAILLLAIVAISVVILVLGREVNIPVVWLDEISTYSVVWIIFIGLALGYKHNMFPRVDIICNLTPKSWKPYYDVFWDVVALAFLLIVVWSGKDYIIQAYNSKTTSAQLRLPLYVVYMGPIIGYLFTLYFTICNIVTNIAGMKKRKEREEA